MATIYQHKKDLREKVLAKRNKISEKDWLVRSRKIIAHLQNMDNYKKAGVVHCYVSMNERNEVCTDELIEAMLAEGKRVVVPVTNFSEISLKHVEIEGLDQLKTNKLGIREPSGEKEVAVQELDLIIIPMAAADIKGNRLGYGKGFYDRFLTNTKAIKIGFVFQKFLFDKIPVEEYDVKLDAVITEEGAIIP